MTELGRRRLLLKLAPLVLAALLLANCAGDGREPSTTVGSSSSAPAASTTVAVTTMSWPAEPEPLTTVPPLPDGLDQVSFAKNSADAIGLGGTLAYGRGVSMVDLDGDGWDDLILTDADMRVRGPDYGITQAFRNDRGHFVPWDLGFDSADLVSIGAALVGDYNNDGQPDVLFLSGNNTSRGSMVFYENRLQTEKRFVERTVEVGITTALSTWWGGSWGDIDGDGFLDLVVSSNTSTILYRNDGGRQFVEEAAQRGLGDFVFAPCRRNPYFVDIDNDSFPELVCGGGSSLNLFQNDGTGHFEDIKTKAFPGDFPPRWSEESFVSGAADFNQDGYEDLYFGRWWYQDSVMINNGDGTFSLHGADVGIRALIWPEDPPAPLTEPYIPESPPSDNQPEDGWPVSRVLPSYARANTMGLTLGDMDLNGTPDVLIGSGDPGDANRSLMFCGRPAGSKAGVEFVPCQSSVLDQVGIDRMHGMALGDINRDGRPDLIMNPGGFPPWDAQSGEDSRSARLAFLGTGDGSRTVEIRLRTHGRAAIGARLAVHALPPHYDTVRSAQGFQTQSSEVLSFVLGEPTSITITWPDGATSDFMVSPGDRLTLDQPTR